MTPNEEIEKALEWLRRYFNGDIETGTDSDAIIMLDTLTAAIKPEALEVGETLDNFIFHGKRFEPSITVTSVSLGYSNGGVYSFDAKVFDEIVNLTISAAPAKVKG